MPVYNGVRYLADAVQAISCQDYSNIEFIAVDDGSSDGSYDLLKELTKDLNAKVIAKTNGGISSARNRGLDEASGKYIVFMDQDDLIPADYISGLVNAIESLKADIVIGGTRQTADGVHYKSRDLNPSGPYAIYRNTAPWGRIYLRSLIEDNHIRFMDTRVSEDFYFNYVALTHGRKVAAIKQSGYVWKIDPKSESHSNMSRLADNRTEDLLMVLDNSLRDMDPNSRSVYTDYMLLKHAVWYLMFTCKGSAKEEIKDTYDRLIAWLDTNLTGYERIFGLKITNPKGETFKIRATVRTAMALKRMGLLLKFLYMLR